MTGSADNMPNEAPMPDTYIVPEYKLLTDDEGTPKREVNESLRAQRAVRAEANIDRAKDACMLYADGVSLKEALSLVGLSLSGFFEQRRKSQEVREAWTQAKEIKAEAKLDGISNLRDALLDGSIEKDIYHELVATEKWLVSKLSPDTYGVKASTTTDNRQVNVGSIQILQTMSDEDILKLVGAEKSPQMALGTPSPSEGISLPPEANLPPTQPPQAQTRAPFTNRGGAVEGEADKLIADMEELIGEDDAD